jgi:hypothetical protein
MSYGSKLTSDGKTINANESRVIPTVGIVDDCEIKTGFELNDDNSVASITFVQGNGAEVTHKEWLSDDAASIDGTNRRVKHICTKLVSEAEYDNAVSAATSFADFFNRVNALINGKTTGKFRMVFHYNNKGYVTIPRFPNFIESMSVVPTKLVLSKYIQDRLVRPEAPKADIDMDMTVGGDLPF